ncbi:MAG: TolC family protein [Bacteriovoracaceae bacterium]
MIFRISLLFLLLLNFPALFAAISESDYIKQVMEKNGELVGTKISIKAKEERKNESKALFHPNLFANSQYIDDQKPVNSISVQGKKTERKVLQAGVTELFPSGTKVNLSYNFLHTEITGASSAFVPQKSFYDLSPQIEVSQSLWRNFLGKENRSMVQVGVNQIEMNQNLDKFKYKQLLMNAKLAYWKLVLSQNNLKVQNELVEGAKRNRDWTTARVQKGLAEEIDLFQANANLKNHEIELQNAQTEMAIVRKNFQSLRDHEDDQEEIKLDVDPISLSDKFLKYDIPSKMKTREDVLAAQNAQKLATFSAILGQEKNRPNLEVFGSYATNGRAVDYSKAMEDTLKTNQPYSVIGIRFNIDLDVLDSNKYLKSYHQEKIAADLLYERKLDEVEKDWKSLEIRFYDLKNNLKLMANLLEIQKRKFELSKNEFKKGKMTTFHMLQFESDYGNSHLLNIKYQLDFLQTYYALQLYSEESYE